MLSEPELGMLQCERRHRPAEVETALTLTYPTCYLPRVRTITYQVYERVHILFCSAFQNLLQSGTIIDHYIIIYLLPNHRSTHCGQYASCASCSPKIFDLYLAILIEIFGVWENQFPSFALHYNNYGAAIVSARLVP